jgi:FAD:protein FMN transferase
MRFLILIIILFSCERPIGEIKISGKAIGTSYHLTFSSKEFSQDDEDEIKLKIDSIFIQFNAEMSTYHKNTEITRFNAALANTEIKISNDFKHVVETSLIISDQSNGAFDITVGPLIELWGFGRKKELKKVVSPSKLDSIRDFISYKKIHLDQNKLSKDHDKLAINLNAIAKGYAVDKLAEFVESLGSTNYLIEIGGELRCMGKNSKKRILENWNQYT